MEQQKETKELKKRETLEKINAEKLRGRVMIFDAEKSEIAKNLKLAKKGDYTQKTK